MALVSMPQHASKRPRCDVDDANTTQFQLLTPNVSLFRFPYGAPWTKFVPVNQLIDLLAVELVCMIGEYSEDSDLHALARVCRRLHIILVPLYCRRAGLAVHAGVVGSRQELYKEQHFRAWGIWRRSLAYEAPASVTFVLSCWPAKALKTAAAVRKFFLEASCLEAAQAIPEATVILLSQLSSEVVHALLAAVACGVQSLYFSYSPVLEEGKCICVTCSIWLTDAVDSFLDGLERHGPIIKYHLHIYLPLSSAHHALDSQFVPRWQRGELDLSA